MTAGTAEQSGVPKGQRPATTSACDIFRYILSTVITLASIALVFYSIGKGYAALPGHPAVLYVLFILVLILLAYLEGLQVAVLALERVPSESLQHSYPRAYRTHKLATRGRGMNVQRFLVGRQFFVVFVVFLCAQLTTFPTLPEDFIPYRWLFVLIIETGLPGALIVLSFGQLMPQLLAASHPRAFLNLVGAEQVLLLTLCFESLGVTHFSWLLAGAAKRLGCCSAASRGGKKGGDGDTVLQMGNTQNGTSGGSSASVTSRTDSAQPLVASVDLFVNESREATVESLVRDGAALGAEPSSAADVASNATVGWLQAHSRGGLDRQLRILGSSEPTGPSSSGAHGSGSDPFGRYPAAAHIAQYLLDEGAPVPRYLLPPHHTQHIPPHLVALDATARHDRLALRVAELEEALQQLRPSGAGGDDSTGNAALGGARGGAAPTEAEALKCGHMEAV